MDAPAKVAIASPWEKVKGREAGQGRREGSGGGVGSRGIEQRGHRGGVGNIVAGSKLFLYSVAKEK